MQFSEHFVVPNFILDPLSPIIPRKKLHFSHYAKKNPQNISINRIIDHESNFHESAEEGFSFRDDTPKKMVKKYSYDDFETVQKGNQMMIEVKNGEHLSRTGSALTGEHNNSYFSCMANIEIMKAEEPTFVVNNDLKWEMGGASRTENKEATLKPNYEELKKQLKIKIESSNARTKRTKSRNSNDHLKKISKHYERKEFVKMSMEEVLDYYENKIPKRSILSSKLYDVIFYESILLKNCDFVYILIY